MCNWSLWDIAVCCESIAAFNYYPQGFGFKMNQKLHSYVQNVTLLSISVIYIRNIFRKAFNTWMTVLSCILQIIENVVTAHNNYSTMQWVCANWK